MMCGAGHNHCGGEGQVAVVKQSKKARTETPPRSATCTAMELRDVEDSSVQLSWPGEGNARAAKLREALDSRRMLPRRPPPRPSRVTPGRARKKAPSRCLSPPFSDQQPRIRHFTHHHFLFVHRVRDVRQAVARRHADLQPLFVAGLRRLRGRHVRRVRRRPAADVSR